MSLGHGTVRGLGISAWLIMALGLGFELRVAGTSPQAAESVLMGTLALFFVAILSRLALAMKLARGRRRPLFVLMVSVIFWAAGSVVLGASTKPDITTFPAPGEWLFLVSYVGMAGYLILDTAHRPSTALATWLEAIVVCGGTACLSGTLLVTPVAGAFGQDGLALLLALLYPLIDLALALLVVGQVALRARGGIKQAGALIVGFLIFAWADTTFVANLSKGTYSFSVINDLAYGAAFALIVGAAVRSRLVATNKLPRRPGPTVMVCAAATAILVLTLRPSDGVGTYLAVPAVVTLLGAGGRLVLALREANGAAEAFALSRTDDLTLLPNRRAVLARLDDTLAMPRPLALMMLDLDGFKDVNDTLGHAAGDTVLQLVAHRMREVLPPEVVVARLGGDEFAVIVFDEDELLLMETAQQILDTVRQPLLIDGIELATNASIGITLRSSSDAGSTDLLRRADVAMYQSKLTRSGALLYDAHRDDFSRQKLKLAEDLRKGILDGQLVLWYQPQIDAATQRLCGLEALVRWQHPEQGLLPPAVFLPAARRAGLMLQLSEAVGRMAVNDLARWNKSGLDIRVALNCAPPELLSGMFLPRLFEAVKRSGLSPESLVIEVTEDSFLADPERARTILDDIRQQGLQVAIDDYGTGFSSLSYLRDLPVHELKMDRSFIAALRTDPRSRMIVSSTFQMAHALGLRMVAEGVEDAATAADLVAMGVDVLQGYHLARPMPAAEIEPWAQQWQSFADGVHSMRIDGNG
jgi:diguanylate cyclase (GGDEF)-like protein